MAQTKAPPKSEAPVGVALTRVKKSFTPTLGARRGTRNVIIDPTGKSRGNAAGSDAMDLLARELGKDPATYTASFGVNTELGIIGMYIDIPGAEGSVAVKHSKKRIVSFHLGAVFEEYPELKPSGRVEVKIERTIDAAGEPYIMIPMKQATPKVTRSRKKKTDPATTA
jgi:hypothetical protein